jgi:hypothetical protein
MRDGLPAQRITGRTPTRVLVSEMGRPHRTADDALVVAAATSGDLTTHRNLARPGRHTLNCLSTIACPSRPRPGPPAAGSRRNPSRSPGAHDPAPPITSSPASPTGPAARSRVNHGQMPSVQRQPDAHRFIARQSCRAGDHRGLGRTVGVPYLRVLPRQPVGQPARTALTAQDQQADAVRRARRP